MAIMMFGEPGATSSIRSRLSHLSLDDRVHRRAAVRSRCARKRLCLLRGRDAFAMTPNTRLIILNSPANRPRGHPQSEIDALVKGLAAFPTRRFYRRDLRPDDYDGLGHQTLLAYPQIRDG